MSTKRIAPNQILEATVSGIWVDQDGAQYPYTAGRTRVRASHPLAKAVPGAFKPIEVHYDVETATRTPGRGLG